MTSTELEIDKTARDAVVNELERTLFLEAGAGSGKTSCLVGRFVALVESGIPADHIAAITFTEKAAAELVDRIRTELRRRAPDNEACRDALLVLDSAAIGTLHAFAQRILTEHAIEAGLPPRFAVHDEIASQVAFETRWELFADGLLDDESLEMPLRLLFASGGKPKHLRDVAVAFNANWDLVVDRIDLAPPPVPSVDVRDILTDLKAVIDLAQRCTDEDDLLFRHLTDMVTDFEARLRAAVDDDSRVKLLDAPKLKSKRGQTKNWTSIGVGVVRDRLSDLQDACAALRSAVLESVLQRLATSLAQFTAESATARREAGELEFHDLLVLARNMLRSDVAGPDVRRALAQRYDRLLLDEFQDTDPIQIEIAVLIASDDQEAGQKHWSAIRTEPGRIFFVGDPKQSIYRFRRADIGMFMTARDELVGASLQLSRNFRTGEPIIAWVNATFAKLIVGEGTSQPEYQALLAERGRPEIGPPVAFIGREHDRRLPADELRSQEAADVSASIQRAIREAWSVADRTPSHVESWRPARWSDIAVLLPARTSLPFLERALDEANIPFRAETSSLVYGSREVRELMLVVRAVDDPTDSLAAVSALRTTAFGCGDDDLFVWKKRYRGGWDHQAAVPEDAPVDHPVAQGIAWLAAIHLERQWLSPSQVLDRILRERRFYELAAADRRPRDLWRRLRFVVDQCRAWEEAGGSTLREYLQWVEGQSGEGTRVVETVLPETDDDAVRILTIHGVKGLEFPIVILSGLTTQMNPQPRGVEVRFLESAGWAIKLSKRLSTTDFEDTQPVEEQMGHHERLRLLYVASTRARDHLVISAHRKERGTRTTLTSAEVLYDAGWNLALADELDLADQPLRPQREFQVVSDPPDLPTLEEWQAAHDAALKDASRPLTTSAIGLARARAAEKELDPALSRAAAADPGLTKGARDIDLPPWQKGRYGSAIGRAVHGALQTVDLATANGLTAVCAAQAAAEGVLGKQDVIRALAQAALDSEVLKLAAAQRHWREVYVGVPWENGILEGYIDLLYESDEGLVIVDYKTDAWRTETELDAKVSLYSVQLQAYADAVRTAVDREVVGALLLFLRPEGAVARPVSIAASLS
ncbi:UvrD-helicase domain-containing protein [Mycobacterium yunnanensis]|uniref:DNA 3'-5' helicase n=1 Tax=Mycobacterium yunnanensis TaxID=368477 RepID=A0A9X3C1H9_9MYCO|nr:UvrD-helicase domain-containing protein [Mycobacterium yunnanensis]MCV7421388.1 UvrD-helicase domain-containing protein [Mycobacterium yunnanensis]